MPVRTSQGGLGFGGSFFDRVQWNLPWIDYGFGANVTALKSRNLSNLNGSDNDAGNLWTKGSHSVLTSLNIPVPTIQLASNTIGAPVPPQSGELSSSATMFGFNPKQARKFGLYAVVVGLRQEVATGAPAGSARFGFVSRNPIPPAWRTHAHAIFVSPDLGDGGNTLFSDPWRWQAMAGGDGVGQSIVVSDVADRPPDEIAAGLDTNPGSLLEVLLLPSLPGQTLGRAKFFHNGRLVAEVIPPTWRDLNTQSSSWKIILQLVNQIDETNNRFFLSQIGAYHIDAMGL